MRAALQYVTTMIDDIRSHRSYDCSTQHRRFPIRPQQKSNSSSRLVFMTSSLAS